MVADLLRGFVHEDWVQHIDFDSLEKVGGTYVADDLREREDDVIWRVRWGQQDWLYVYLLIEFQSTVDRYMAVRILVYLGLLYQDLVRTGNLAADGRLPPVGCAGRSCRACRSDAGWLGNLPPTAEVFSPG